MISSCNGRNEVKPKYCFSSGSNSGAADFTLEKYGSDAGVQALACPSPLKQKQAEA
jgi:hypothetical protein